MSVYRMKKARSGPSGAAAFYDLDGTLVDLNLVHVALFVLSNLGEWGRRVGYLLGFASRLPRLYTAERLDRRLLNVRLFEVFRGVSRDRLNALGEEYIERRLWPHLYPRAVELIEANRRAGFEPVLVTGAPEFVVAPLAERFGIRDYAANRLHFSRGRATGRLIEPIMAGDEKHRWCSEYAAWRRLDLGQCWGYADSYYDLPFLTAMGHPVAVNPDRKLEAAAESRQWPIVRFEKPRSGARSELHDGDQDGCGEASDGAA